MKQTSMFGQTAAFASLRLIADVDPMDANCADIDTSYPVLVAGTQEMTVKSSELVDNKDKSGKNLVIKLATIVDGKGTKGQIVPKGHTITVYYPASPLGERTNDKGKALRPVTNADIAKSIAGPVKSAGLNTTPRMFLDNVAVLNGKNVLVEVSVKPASDGFPPSNGISEWLVRK